MGRIATNTITQIKCLTDRGMILDYDEPKIKEFLLDIGYYRLGFYWNPFEIDDDHNFEEETKFSDVVTLYYLDVDLRNILLKYINRIEINFRTKLVYYVSNKHKESLTWFADPSFVNQKLIDDIENLYDEDFIKAKHALKAHHRKYPDDAYAPAWKTLEFFTFGTIIKIFKNIKDEDIKERISKELGVNNNSKFINLIETVLLVRNKCAHGDVLFDLRTPKGISIIPDINFNNNDRSSLDSCIKVVSYFLGKISQNRKNDLEKKISELFDSHSKNEVIRNIITTKINYKY